MENMRENRLLEENFNSQGCLMKIIEYNSYSDILVEFQDEYKYRTRAGYKEFKSGSIKNWYHPSVCGVGIVGDKYKDCITKNGKMSHEYKTWSSLLLRCFDENYKIKEITYQDVTCCKEWLSYENFYEWLYQQENFEKWLNNDDWAIDKDILIKGNKIYSPNTCCLVPRIVNSLFIKRTNDRGIYPIGVTKHKDRFRARCDNPLLKTRKHIGLYNTPEEAFQAYKQYKENLIRQVAQEEYSKGNIIQSCYEAMMKYEVEITD